MINVDLSRNPKQYEFVMRAVESAMGYNPFRKHHIGGSIRGGKTVACLTTLVLMANAFPRSRWYVIRKDLPTLIDTTVPSLERILFSSRWKWHRDKSDYYVENPAGSRIYMLPENLRNDPDLKAWLGLEANGFLLEQAEELSKKTYEMACSRAGSLILPKMPKPLILTNFNPNQTWIKEFVYQRYINDELPADTYYQQVVPQDNEYITEEQYAMWSEMDKRFQDQFIQGLWDDFDSKDNRFVYTFDPGLHVGKVTYNPNKELVLSFDFNCDPITCLVAHIDRESIEVVEQIKLANSNIYELCNYIISIYGHRLFRVTGDATGYNKSALVQDQLNFYKVIRKLLSVPPRLLEVEPGRNPSLKDNRVLVNTVFHKLRVVIDEKNAVGLITDLRDVRVKPNGEIIKENRKKDDQQADCLDCLRYLCNTYFRWLLNRL